MSKENNKMDIRQITAVEIKTKWTTSPHTDKEIHITIIRHALACVFDWDIPLSSLLFCTEPKFFGRANCSGGRKSQPTRESK